MNLVLSLLSLSHIDAIQLAVLVKVFSVVLIVFSSTMVFCWVGFAYAVIVCKSGQCYR